MGLRYLRLVPGKAPEWAEIEDASVRDYRGAKAVIQTEIGGGDVEHVSVLWRGRRSDMFVDEEGQLRGLPLNDEATAIYRAWTLSQRPGTDPASLPDIRGVAVIFEKIIWS